LGPVVWIDACAPHQWQIVDAERPLPTIPPGERAAPDRNTTVDDLQQTVHHQLELPRIEPGEAHDAANSELLAQRRVAVFYAERQPAWNPAVVWRMFQSVVGDFRLPNFSLDVEDFENAVEEEWGDDPHSPVGRMADWLRPFFAWPDQLAVLYADRYRSAFVLAFSLAAAAVSLALLPDGAGLAKHGEKTCMVLELGAIMTILAVVQAGRRYRWHERWLDYRLTAELVRHLRLVAPLGGGRPFPQVPAHWTTYGQPGATWMAWYVRAVERELGLPSVVVDDSYLKICLEHLQKQVKLQIGFHERTAGRCHRIEHRLHHWGIALLLLTLLSCGLHLFYSGNLEESAHGAWSALSLLTFVCGVFPALGAAMAGISNQAEFRRIARRSKAMAKQLESLSGRIEYLCAQIETRSGSGKQLSNQAVLLAGDVARLLINEVLDWRVVFLDRPLDPPA
jgi:hypothetical protein